MKALDDTLQTPQRESAAADLAARVKAIFKQYPLLCGFSVREYSTLTEDCAIVQLQGELCLTDVSVNTWPGFRVTQEYYEQIAYMLLELMDEQPEAGDLLPGRTFARTLH